MMNKLKFLFGKDWSVNGKPNPFQHLRFYALGTIILLGVAMAGGVICLVLNLSGLISKEAGQSMYMVCRVFFMVGFVLGIAWNIGVLKGQEKHRLDQVDKK